MTRICLNLNPVPNLVFEAFLLEKVVDISDAILEKESQCQRRTRARLRMTKYPDLTCFTLPLLERGSEWIHGPHPNFTF